MVTFLDLCVWALGVIEFVNYFVVRLAYPPSQWFSKVGQWREPRLLPDMTHRDVGGLISEGIVCARPAHS